MSSKKSLTVLAVDLDHTLIHTDMIYLGFKQILFKKLYLMPILLYLLFAKGKPSAKKYLYDNTTFDLKVVPFNTELIKFIKAERHNYDHTILISGSYHKYVLICRYLIILGIIKKIFQFGRYQEKFLLLIMEISRGIFHI
jgi:hypothetical protein